MLKIRDKILAILGNKKPLFLRSFYEVLGQIRSFYEAFLYSILQYCTVLEQQKTALQRHFSLVTRFFSWRSKRDLNSLLISLYR